MKPGLIAAALVGATLLVSCKKDPTQHHPPPPPPADGATRIAIKLNQDYLSAANIDSAVLVWETSAGGREVRLQLSNDTLFSETKELTKGTGRLTVQIFSTVKLRQQNLQWEQQQEVTLNSDASINWKAPTSYDDPAWNPRVILMDAVSKLTAVVALRPTDPYFLLKNIPAGFRIELERNYTRIPGGAEIVAGGTWTCNAGCTDARGIIENREFFRPLATQIAGREWKMVETGVGLFGANGSSGGVLYFNYY